MKFDLKKSRKAIIYLIGIISFLFIVERFFIADLRNSLHKLRSKIRLAEAQLRKALEIQRNKERIVFDYKKSQPFLKIKKLGEKQIIALVLKEIENIARFSGASILNLTPEEEIEKTREYKKYKADFRLESTLQELITFLNKLQESKLLIKLDRISIFSKDEEKGILRVDGTISLAIPL
jgi:hypothetical protein